MAAFDVPRNDPDEHVDADGNIVTGARRDRIRPEFWPVLERAIRHVGTFGDGAALYVYGSVATGRARVGSSDIDLVTIGVDAARARTLAHDLSAASHGLCRGVDIGPARPTDYDGPGDEAYGNRVFLRHYCVHLWGPDRASAMPAFPADHAAARGFNGDIALRAARWRSESGGSDPAALAVRIARKTLFAVAGLVSMHDGVWTTDRAASARRWGVVKPALAQSLATLVAWGFDPPRPRPPSQIQQVLDGVVADVVADFQQRIGLWR